MINPRFYDYTFSKGVSLEEVIKWIGGSLLETPRDKDIHISGVNTLDEAIESELVYFDDVSYVDKFLKTKAHICITSPKLKSKLSSTIMPIVVESPKRIFAMIANKLYSLKKIAEQKEPIHPSAKISKTARIGANVSIGAYSVIGDHATLDAFVCVGPGVQIGKHTYIESHATLVCADIGNYVRVGSGARVGQEGFGFIMDEKGHITMPHLGFVKIENNVRLGANCCIDRGTLGATYLREGCRIDNLVQIAHNVDVGSGSVLAAQVGISGSTKIGKHVLMGGQVGVTQHLTISDGTQIAAQSGVMRDIPEKSIYSGSPAVPIMQWRRQNIMLQRMVKKKRV